VTSHAFEAFPLSQTVTFSRTPPPSSVTYLMDGPLTSLHQQKNKGKTQKEQVDILCLFYSQKNAIPYF